MSHVTIMTLDRDAYAYDHRLCVLTTPEETLVLDALTFWTYLLDTKRKCREADVFFRVQQVEINHERPRNSPLLPEGRTEPPCH